MLTDQAACEFIFVHGYQQLKAILKQPQNCTHNTETDKAPMHSNSSQPLLILSMQLSKCVSFI